MTSYLDELLRADPDSSYREAWLALEAELSELADVDKTPFRHHYLHMNHGPGHWSQVRANAAVVWKAATQTHPEWANSESAFLLSAAAYLHDIAMVLGWMGLDSSRLELGDHLDHYFTRYGFDRTDELPPKKADTPIGRYVIRKRQGPIARETVRLWNRERRFFLEKVGHGTVGKLEFLVENYSKPTFLLADEAEKTAPGAARHLLALSAALQFADWSHLDRSRVAKRTGLLAVAELQRFLTDPSRRLNEFADPIGLLPKWFRSHYVMKAEPEQTEPAEDGRPRIRIDIRLACPAELPTRNGDHAFRRLVREWEGKFHPPMELDRNLGDALKEYAGVDLEYAPPQVREWQEHNAFVELPGFVRDYWIASKWFDLDESAQFLAVEQGDRTPWSDLAVAIQPEYLYYRLGIRREFIPSSRPALSRRAMLWIHINITKGQSYLANAFFRQLSHDVCRSSCSAGTTEHRMGRPFGLKERIANAIVSVEALLTLDVERIWGFDIERLAPDHQTVIGTIARMTGWAEVPLGRVTEACADVGVGSGSVEDTLQLCFEVEAVQSGSEDSFRVHPSSPAGGLFTLIGAGDVLRAEKQMREVA